MSKKALITGVTGQDGAYLAHLLLAKGYTVAGTTREISSGATSKLKALGIEKDIQLLSVDLTAFDQVKELLQEIKPNQIYNLAGPSSVSESFVQPLEAATAITQSVANILEAIRTGHPKIRFYQASSSEMFGSTFGDSFNEESILRPSSPYAIAKAFAHLLTKTYRNCHGLFACSGILFNHESPLRGLNYVSRKITNALARIERGNNGCLELGNVDVERDFGYAGDYVKAMHLMMSSVEPDDYVVATGESHSIRDFVDTALTICGITCEWIGKGVNERCIDVSTGATLVRIDPALYRPLEIDRSKGNAQKARQQLRWSPTITFCELVEMMIKADRESVLNEC